MPDIMHRLSISSDPQRVYAAITTTEGVRSWWVRDADLEPWVGGSGEFRFLHYGPGHIHRITIEALMPEQEVTWRIQSSFISEWNGTQIAFHLTRSNAGTDIRFAHRGYMKADDIYAMCTTGWGYYLVSLKQYVETGEGGPSPNVDFSRMLQSVS
ncbi:Aha1 domain protein [Acidisarcina polymorpha]|uniref:Aha1 domain protein n=1 Tax=Acidisarcina polymorpha TaxID=2211140 RepID=A0A2Z5FTH3_9BACT|nr:SRPBCC domain-containing protein [Acidisarcina polymorpha]AXC09797.1 Aha1 domain protein [Acidisarcina polymorpha]